VNERKTRGSLRVLIVGAGISGLALARALADRGITADIVERGSDDRPAGTGLYLPANAVRALQRIGVGDEVAKRAAPIRRQRLLDHRSRLLSEFDVSRIWGDTGDCLAISRGDLHEVLRTAVGEGAIRYGVQVTDADAEGSVTFADGSSDSYDVVVGADGYNSAVRRSAFGPVEPRFLGQLCWRFIAEDRTGKVESDWTVRLGSGGRTFLTVQLGGGRIYCYADVNSTERVPSVSDWRTHFTDFTGAVPGLLAQGTDAHFAPLSEFSGTDWIRHRAVLIGDAAHSFSPSMAQGGAMALEDALVLAELLGQQKTVETALPAFVSRRGHRVQWVLKQNHKRDAARNLPTVLRNLSLRYAGEKLFKANHAPLHDLP